MEPCVKEKLEQAINQLWKELSPVVKFDCVPDSEPIVELTGEQACSSIVAHRNKNQLPFTKVAISVYLSAKMSENFNKFINTKAPTVTCTALEKRIKLHCYNIMKAAGYQTTRGRMMQDYGRIQGYLETSNIAVQPCDNLAAVYSRGFIATINVTLYVAKPKDVLQLAIKSPQEHKQ